MIESWTRTAHCARFYDELVPPNSKHYRETADEDDQTPAIVFGKAPRTNFLATSSEAWFFGSIREDDVSGGFVPRWCIVLAGDTDKTVSTPAEPDPALVPPMLEKLKKIAKLEGAMDTSRIQKAYDGWYGDTKRRFTAQPQRHLADAFWGRHSVHVLKLAAIFELAISATLVISPAAFERAAVVARVLEENIFSLLRTNFSAEGVESRNLEELVRSTGPKGLSKNELSQQTRGKKRFEMINRLKTLLDGEVVSWFVRKTVGRPGLYLVHSDHLTRHAKEFPEDRPAERANGG